MLDAATIDRIRRDYTAPYYLSMRIHDPDPAQLASLARLSRRAGLDEVLWMLGTLEWRSRKMGAWFSLVRPEPEVGEALEESLRSSQGSFTAPELGVALVRRIGTGALPALLDYQAAAARADHGRLGMTSALIELAGGGPGVDEPLEWDRAKIAQMVRVAELIEAAAVEAGE